MGAAVPQLLCTCTARSLFACAAVICLAVCAYNRNWSMLAVLFAAFLLVTAVYYFALPCVNSEADDDQQVGGVDCQEVAGTGAAEVRTINVAVERKHHDGHKVPEEDEEEDEEEAGPPAPQRKPRPAILAVGPAQGVIRRESQHRRAVVLAAAPDPAQLERDRMRRKKRGARRPASTEPIKFGFTGAQPITAPRAMPRQDPSKTPSENAAVRMMYRGRTMPQPASARSGLVSGMMRDFPFRPARGMVLASGRGR